MIIIGGNHDSPSFLNAPKYLLEAFGATVIGDVPRIDGVPDLNQLVIPVVKNNQLLGVVCAVPWLRRGDLSSISKSENSDTNVYKELFSSLYDTACKKADNKDVPIILTAHLMSLPVNYETSDGVVGGADNVDYECFGNDFSYVALGHIHKSQKINQNPNMRYSGSPIAFSFNEKDYNHSLTSVSFENSTVSEIRLLEIPQVFKLAVVPDFQGDYQQVRQAVTQFPDNMPAYLEINLLPDLRTSEFKQEIIQILAKKRAKFCSWHIGKRLKINEGEDISVQESVEQFKAQKPIDILNDVFCRKYGKTLSDKQINLLQNLIDEL